MMYKSTTNPVFKLLSLAAVVALVGGCALATSKPQQAAVEEPAEPATEMVMKEMVLDTRTLFEFDSAQLTSDGMESLDRLVERAGGEAAGQVSITGHTDRIGSEEYNQDLSERRAASVGDYMVQQGVSAGSITTAGRGESEPIVTCEDQPWDALVECLQPNRRVVVELPVTVEEEVVTDN